MARAETFSKVSQGVQSIVVTLAVIIGGVWTVYTFSVLGTTEKAKLELFQQAVLDVSLSARQESIGGDERFYIIGEAVLTNKGNRNTMIGEECTIVLSKFSFDESGKGHWEKMSEFSYGKEILLRSGASRQFPFATTVSEKGMYSVEFLTPVTDKNDQRILNESRTSEIVAGTASGVWYSSTYLIVK